MGLSGYPDNPDLIQWANGTEQQATQTSPREQSHDRLSRLGRIMGAAAALAPQAPEYPSLWRG